MNKEWHAQNPMPKNPTLDQRIAWHVEHTKNCGCREMPESIKKALAEKNNKR